MATTQEQSIQFTKLTTPSTKGGPIDGMGGLGIIAFDHTQSTDGDTASTVALCQIPPGRYEVIAVHSLVEFSAFGTGRTLDIGWLAYTQPDDSTAAADTDGLLDGADVSSAGLVLPGNTAWGVNLGVNTARRKVFNSKSGVTLQAINAGGTWPNAAQIHGYFILVGPTS